MKMSITKILLAAVALCAPFSAEVYGFEAEGIYYTITSEADKTVEVTSGEDKYTGDITIPSTVINSGTITITGTDPYTSITGNVNTTARTIDSADMPS